MTHPVFSIPSPGRQRPQAPGYARRSVRFQEPQDFDPIAMDNRAGPDVLSMKENWEAGLDLTQGEDRFFMGDGAAPIHALEGLAVSCPEADALLVPVLMIP